MRSGQRGTVSRTVAARRFVFLEGLDLRKYRERRPDRCPVGRPGWQMPATSRYPVRVSGFWRGAPGGSSEVVLPAPGSTLADVQQILAHRDEPDLVRAVLDAHFARLEQGLALARHELSAVLHAIDQAEPTVTSILTLPATDLAAALRGVGFAVGQDPAQPALHGVLLDLSGDTLHVVATDRYPLAVCTTPVVGTGTDAQTVTALIPVSFADDVQTACVAADGEHNRLSLGRQITVRAGEQHEIFIEVALGKSNTEIATELHLSENTVKTHVKRILAKLELRDRVQAVILAYDSGIVTPS